MPKRILFIDETAQVGGAEINLLLLVKGLKQRRWDPIVILPSEGPFYARLEGQGISVQLVPGAPRYSISFYLPKGKKTPNPLAWGLNMLSGMLWAHRLRRAIDSLNPDIVQTVSIWSHLFGGLAAARAGFPHVAHVQDLVGSKAYRGLLHCWARSIPDQIVSISQIVADQFQDVRGSKERVKTIWNTVDLERFSPPDDWLSADGKEPLRIGTVARITRWKGQHIALRIAKQLRQRGIPFQWHFAGDVALGSKEYYQKLLQDVRAWDLAEQVHFIGWVEEMPAFYRRLDVLVHLPVEPEPFGLVLAEGIASGLPVIASGGGADDLVLQSGGTVVPPGQVKPVADALIDLWHRPQKRVSAAKGARKFARRTFGLDPYVDQWENVYDSLIGAQ